MTELRLYDTLTRTKQTFESREADRITMYLCGPTVYGRAHIGNARPAVVIDVLARLLRHLYPNHRLDYARNITDVDDKIIVAAEAEGVAPSVITRRFEKHYLDDTAALGVEPPSFEPRATENIDEMKALISRLIELGHAYAAQGHVLFSVASDPGYGSLSRRDADAMRAGARVEVAPYKRDPGDFVLWKPSDPQVIGWPSPWGRGRPGWHIECSAMIERHLGTTIDIHAGGLDLVFPHHENEAAQSRCAHTGAPLANIWIHNGFLNMAGGEKMSKSLGNVATMEELRAAGHDGEVLRFALLSAHYRQPLEWSDALISQSKATLDYWYRAAQALEAEPRAYAGELAEFDQALLDDLNTPKALAVIGGFMRVMARPDPSAVNEEGQLAHPPGSGVQILAAAVAAARWLGFLRVDPQAWFQGERGTARIAHAIAARAAAKARRDFAEADRIRAGLADEGVVLEDGPAGTSWRRG